MEPFAVQSAQPTADQLRQAGAMMDKYAVFWGITVDAIQLDGSLEKYEQAAKKLEEMGFFVATPVAGFKLLIYNSRKGYWHGQSHLLSTKVISVESLLAESWTKFYV